MAVVQVSPKGQVLIPKAIREKYGVKPGSNVHILEEPGSIIIKPAPEDPIAEACGFLEGDFSLTDDLIKEHRKESENERRHSPR
jgi:AbrB family looped-hinge helix DNA binding protein